MVLTVDSEELNEEECNYEGFSKRKIEFIKETFVLFQHFTYAEDAKDWNWIKMDGAMFSNPQYLYYIHKTSKNDGIHGQVFKKIETEYGKKMLFGFYISPKKDTTLLEYVAYHDSMAPDYDDEI